jgi:hypothetical protein
VSLVKERTAAVVQTRDFLLKLSRESSLPESLRLQAKHLLRHYPTSKDVWLAGRAEERRRHELSLLESKHGPLHPSLGLWLVVDPMFCDESADASSATP